MKVVVIEMPMPENCGSCRLFCDGWCYGIDGDEQERINPCGDKPTWCPLKEIEILEESESNPKADDIKEIIDYLNMATGSSYRASTPKTKQLIKARMKEGFTVDDFKTVIDKKVKAWGKDPKMQGFLRPMTLFGTKFESYLNEKCTSRLGENSFQRMQRLAREGAFDE